MKYVVGASTIDGPVWYSHNEEGDGMTDDPREATPVGEIVAHIVAHELNAQRNNAKTGEEWDNSYHNVKVTPA